MPKIRRGGYIFLAWRSDPPPRHVHVYRAGRLVVKWDLENRTAMKGKEARSRGTTVKIRAVRANHRRKVFEARTWNGKWLALPFARLEVQPTPRDPLAKVFVDKELGGEGFTYVLQSGREGTVHIDHVLEYNKDPDSLRDLLLYRLTLEAQKRIAATSLAKREIIRRLGTSPAQLYRLLDQTNYRKSVDQMFRLFQVLGCDVELVVREKTA